jgi:hypothetical protein
MWKKQVHSWRELTSGYRSSLVSGALACLVSLFINLLVCFWAATLPLPSGDHHSGGRRALYEGSCDEVDSINTRLHVLINILIVVVLSACSYGIQCLSAPTRRRLDKEHSQNKYLDIGVASVRSLWQQKWGVRIPWILLLLSSLPFHLL